MESLAAAPDSVHIWVFLFFPPTSGLCNYECCNLPILEHHSCIVDLLADIVIAFLFFHSFSFVKQRTKRCTKLLVLNPRQIWSKSQSLLQNLLASASHFFLLIMHIHTLKGEICAVINFQFCCKPRFRSTTFEMHCHRRRQGTLLSCLSMVPVVSTVLGPRVWSWHFLQQKKS